MSESFTISLRRIIDDFKLEQIYMPHDPSEVYLKSCDVSRPGLHLSGFYDFFDDDRMQIFGLSELTFLTQQPQVIRSRRVDEFFLHKPPVVVITRNLEVLPEFIECAKEYGVPILRTEDSTSRFMSAIIAYLNVHLAPRITRHGVFVEVYGEGILLMGDSGVGKSETAIELIKRGHRLIADDAVEIRRVSATALVGSAPDNIRHFIELRGIGIINARRIFGMGSVKLTEKIDLVINLEQWDATKVYDRMGLENESTEILGLNITSVTIPVKPGRNLAVIIEVAAMNNRQKKMGYNAAQELLHQLGLEDDVTGAEQSRDT